MHKGVTVVVMLLEEQQDKLKQVNIIVFFITWKIIVISIKLYHDIGIGFGAGIGGGAGGGGGGRGGAGNNFISKYFNSKYEKIY